MVYLLVLIYFLTAGATWAQPSFFSKNVYVEKGDTLRYRQMNPDYNPGRKYPLVIFLHGAGERGNDNEAQLKWGVMNFASEQAMIAHPAIVVVPQCPERMSWSNFSSKKDSREMLLQPTPSKPMEMLMALIQKIIKEQPIDANRIYITGLSMGGFGTFDAMARYPKMFAAAVPVCGGGDASKAATIAHIPTWVFHGAEDATVNPMLSVDMVEALMKAGAHPGYTQYPEVGHFSWLGAYTDPLMIAWLFRQHK